MGVGYISIGGVSVVVVIGVMDVAGVLGLAVGVLQHQPLRLEPEPFFS